MYLFTSEVVSPGHPDKCADIIADSIVDMAIKGDKKSRVATEVMMAGNNVIIGGEIKTNSVISISDYKELVINTLIDIGYRDNNFFSNLECIHPSDIKIQVLLNKQSSEIGQGVDQDSGEIGAGDQGIMFGYANIETKNFMPAAITYARLLMEKIYKYAIENPSKLGVDIKTQVTIDYENKSGFDNCIPKKIHTIVVSTPCVTSMDIDTARTLIKSLIDGADLPTNLYNPNDCIIHINPTGKYTNHSSLHDSGLTGRKLIVDSFGGYSPIGGGAQSSKDYTKVDRSGLYVARWLAKHIVAAKLAKKATVQLSYAIGIANPVSVSVNTENTLLINNIDDDLLSNFILNKFSLTPKWITNKFKLDEPSKDNFLYADVAARGQVGQADYPWEKLDELLLFESLTQ